MSTCWGDAVCIKYGGDAERLRASLVAEQPRRFLFTGHTDVDLGDGELRLGFTKPGGWLEAVDTELVAQVLGAHCVGGGGCLELAFLNGCRSEPLGEAVRRAGVPTVVCWQGRVVDAAARIFARAFFQAVAAGMEYGRAYDEARRAVQLATRRSGAVATPLYELRDPDEPKEPRGGATTSSDGARPTPPPTETASTGGGHASAASPPSKRLTPKRIAVGVPLLLCEGVGGVPLRIGAV